MRRNQNLEQKLLLFAMNTTLNPARFVRLKSIQGVVLALCVNAVALAQGDGPALVDSRLSVRTVVTNLDKPTSLAFLGNNDLFVLEKASGRVQRVRDGSVQSTVLDLAVNSASERGLLGIALHPDFPKTPAVYLYWTES